MPAAALVDLLAPGRELRGTPSGIPSTLAEADSGAPYDRLAAMYDRLVGNRIYNRVLWGTSPSDYAAFADEAVVAGAGWYLDAGCGTAVFTAAPYRASTRQIVLLDRSVGMLEKARDRIASDRVALVQGDLFDLPFAPGKFETVACHAMLHVLDDPWTALANLAPQLASGGRLFASMLVTDRGGVSGPYLRMLKGRGELGPLRSADEFEHVAREIFGASAAVTRTGSMAWLRAHRTA